MTVKTHEGVRAVFIQSHSYGDLVLTMALLEGHELGGNAALMLPDRLFSDNHELPLSTYRYTSDADILSVVDIWEPDVVFFVSAYVLVSSGTLPLPSMDGLVRQLRARGCRLVTTDPFLGLTRNFNVSQVDLPLSRLSWLARLRQLRKIKGMFRTLSRTARTFKDVTHLYPVPTDGLLTNDGVHRVSFFNPRIVRSHAESSGGDRQRSTADPGAAERSWLFILGAVDHGCQCFVWGPENFASIVASKLEQARRQGRRPVLVAPRSLTDVVSSRLSAEARAELVPFCSYADYISRLFDAEYAFFWNALSASILLRLANSLPVFFFDPGHLQRFFKPCYQAGVHCNYGGFEPRLLDAQEPLDAHALANLVAEQRQMVVAIRNHWQRSPEPDQVIDRLLRDSGTG
jgi:hypothetical protein